MKRQINGTAKTQEDKGKNLLSTVLTNEYPID